MAAAAGIGAGVLDGKGQTIGLFELDGFDPNDIKLFVNQFGLPTVLDPAATTTVPAKTGGVIPVLIDNFSGTPSDPTGGQDEVTLDIDMVLALAPNATAVYSYEGLRESITSHHRHRSCAGHLSADGRRHGDRRQRQAAPSGDQLQLGRPGNR